MAQKIRQAAAEAGISVPQLAAALGTDPETVERWMAGTALPPTQVLADLAHEFGRTVGWLFGEGQIAHEPWILKDQFFSAKKTYSWLRGYSAAREMWLTCKALPLARRLHEGQVRKGASGVPYIVHPLTVACHLVGLGLDEDELVAAALLHDVMEDCGMSAEDLLAEGMTPRVVRTVQLVSFLPKESADRQEAMAVHYRGIGADRDASLVKVVDRCNNISCMPVGFSPEKMASYITETEQYVMPLLEMIKERHPECYHAVYLIKYQMLCVLESLKWILD